MCKSARADYTKEHPQRYHNHHRAFRFRQQRCRNSETQERLQQLSLGGDTASGQPSGHVSIEALNISGSGISIARQITGY